MHHSGSWSSRTDGSVGRGYSSSGLIAALAVLIRYRRLMLLGLVAGVLAAAVVLLVPRPPRTVVVATVTVEPVPPALRAYLPVDVPRLFRSFLFDPATTARAYRAAGLPAVERLGSAGAPGDAAAGGDAAAADAAAWINRLARLFAAEALRVRTLPSGDLAVAVESVDAAAAERYLSELIAGAGAALGDHLSRRMPEVRSLIAADRSRQEILMQRVVTAALVDAAARETGGGVPDRSARAIVDRLVLEGSPLVADLGRVSAAEVAVARLGAAPSSLVTPAPDRARFRGEQPRRTGLAVAALLIPVALAAATAFFRDRLDRAFASPQERARYLAITSVRPSGSVYSPRGVIQ